MELSTDGITGKLCCSGTTFCLLIGILYPEFGPCIDYYYLLHEHLLGNFKTFVYDMGLTPAMLKYLDGESNRVGAPNENYARELLELFTMGPTAPDGTPNYTETDVAEIARALTGWVVTDDFHVEFDESRHDAGMKSFLGRQGMYGYDQVIDILFEERAHAIAHHLSRHLYCFFVRPLPDESVVSDLADVLLDNNFEIKPALQVLFSSTHFYDEANRARASKAPWNTSRVVCAPPIPSL